MASPRGEQGKDAVEPPQPTLERVLLALPGAVHPLLPNTMVDPEIDLKF